MQIEGGALKIEYFGKPHILYVREAKNIRIERNGLSPTPVPYPKRGREEKKPIPNYKEVEQLKLNTIPPN
jgi:hypothetical protein